MAPSASGASRLDCEREKNKTKQDLGKVDSSAWEWNASWLTQCKKLVTGPSIQVYAVLSRFWHIPGTIWFYPDPDSCLSLHIGKFPYDREFIDSFNIVTSFPFISLKSSLIPPTYHAPSSSMHSSDIYWEKIWCLCLEAPECLEWWSCFHRLQVNPQFIQLHAWNWRNSTKIKATNEDRANKECINLGETKCPL